ncbi:acyltransferase family protein [Methylobacterium sp. P5_C11]
MDKNLTSKASLISLDATRFFAAMMVVVYHFLFYSWNEPSSYCGIGFLTSGGPNYHQFVSLTWFGWLGVQIFFCISGFVIVYSAVNKSVSSFMTSRIERLFPALLFFSTINFVVMFFEHCTSTQALIISFLKSITLFPKGPWIDGSIWTLTVEIVFYFLIALCLLISNQRMIYAVARAWLAAVSFGTILIALQLFDSNSSAGALMLQFSHTYISRPLMFSTGAFFLTGIFGYEIYSTGQSNQRCFLLFTSIFVAAFHIHLACLDLKAVNEFGQSSLIPIMFFILAVALVSLALYFERRATIDSRLTKFVRRIGLATYPIYLINQIFGGWMLGFAYKTVGNNVYTCFAMIILVMVLGYAFAVYLEPRIRDAIFKNRHWSHLKYSSQKWPIHNKKFHTISNPS